MITLRFPGTRWPPVAVEPGAPLAEALTPLNSPLLFGCRTGLCGTCLVRVRAEGPLPPPSADEAEILDIHAPDAPDARLACQLCPWVDLDLVVP